MIIQNKIIAASNTKPSTFILAGAPYWIYGIGAKNSAEKYEWSLVSTPNKNMVWILSRTPKLSSENLDDILGLAKTEGLPVDKLDLLQKVFWYQKMLGDLARKTAMYLDIHEDLSTRSTTQIYARGTFAVSLLIFQGQLVVK